ncbi:hypothetical protein J2Z44_002783 [Clostridium punense]|uniref:4'-phosphopantetheinyl transferase domain-containing protein n=1 Tax=Clostridium punense TaxID=1054297 RepID=A0ABS4K5A2_9CLOT|nr:MULTISPECIES: hypothetical protein [Clostridium]EQB89563.1 hypothetical protein M918_20225 [Clostridium sp. BL8]MBP2022958.1 hypothetical protein [Clostridium punense]
MGISLLDFSLEYANNIDKSRYHNYSLMNQQIKLNKFKSSFRVLLTISHKENQVLVAYKLRCIEYAVDIEIKIFPL